VYAPARERTHATRTQHNRLPQCCPQQQQQQKKEATVQERRSCFFFLLLLISSVVYLSVVRSSFFFSSFAFFPITSFIFTVRSALQPRPLFACYIHIHVDTSGENGEMRGECESKKC